MAIEYKTESEQRVIDISKYWIPIIRKTAHFQQIAAAENPEFNLLSEKLCDLEKDGFILTATESGVKRWEHNLGLVASDGMTLDERKAQILNYLNVKTAYTIRTLRQMLAAIVGDGNFKAKVDNETSTLHLSLTHGAMSKMNDIDQLLKRVLPENLGVDLRVEDVPIKYTLLEYIESSGTQRINTGVLMTDDTRIKAVAVATATSANNSLYGLHDLAKRFILRVRQQNKTTFTAQIGSTADVEYTEYERYFSVNLGDVIDVETVGIQQVSVNGVTQNGNYVTPWESSVPMNVPIFAMGYTYGSIVQYNAYGSYKLYGFSIWHGEEKLRDFAPILDETGTPCLYDRVSSRCFYNTGSGTFGYRIKGAENAVMPTVLDDPYYTAPSGVWAKLIDENTLDIITALDPTVDESQGYKLFANVGDAYKYFNIEEVIENE